MPIKYETPVAQDYFAIESLEHSLFLIGGYKLVEGNAKQAVDDMCEYLERKARVVLKERMTEARFNCYAVARRNEIYVIGGENGKENLVYCEKYVIADNTWISLSFLPNPISNGSLCTMKNYIYCIETHIDKSIQLYTYDCIEDKWAEPVSIQGTLSIKSIQFCEPEENEEEIMVFGNKSAFSINVKTQKINYNEDKWTYPSEVQGTNWSHERIDKTIYGITDKCFIKYEEGKPIESIPAYNENELSNSLSK